MSIKTEMEAAAVAVIACPSCKAAAGNRCRKKDGSNAVTHQRRLSAFIASDMVKWIGQTRKATTK